MTNKLIHSIEFARQLANEYAYAATTPEQKEQVAQYMFANDEAVLKAQAIVLGVEDKSGEKAKGMWTEVWLTR